MQKSLTFAEAEAIYRAVGDEVESGAVLALGFAYIDLYRNAYNAAYNRLTEYTSSPGDAEYLDPHKAAEKAAQFIADTRMASLLADVVGGKPAS